MQFQVKIICCLALLVSSLSFASAVNWEDVQAKDINLQKFGSAQGEVISSYFPTLISLGYDIWGWEPRDELKKEPKNTSNLILRELENPVTETMRSLFVNFDVSNPQHFRKVWFQLSPNIKVRGLFGVHDTVKKRPLVIIRMGIHGNVDEFLAERFLAKAIYEDLNFNFLVLESLTSHAFISQNNVATMGGVDEGIQTFLVLEKIFQTKFSKLISETHLMSVSMGSHGTFVTALLDQSNAHRIKTILNFCPLINIKETFAEHFKSGFKNSLVDLWNVRRLHHILDIYPKNGELKEWPKTFLDFKPRFVSSILKILEKERIVPLISVDEIENKVKKMRWPKGFKKHLQSSTNFYELNNYWPFYQNIKTPMTIYTTPNDPLVDNQINSEKIFRGQQPGDFSNLHYMRLEKGVHCGLPGVYRWNYIIKLIKEGLEI